MEVAPGKGRKGIRARLVVTGEARESPSYSSGEEALEEAVLRGFGTE